MWLISILRWCPKCSPYKGAGRGRLHTQGYMKTREIWRCWLWKLEWCGHELRNASKRHKLDRQGKTSSSECSLASLDHSPGTRSANSSSQNWRTHSIFFLFWDGLLPGWPQTPVLKWFYCFGLQGSWETDTHHQAWLHFSCFKPCSLW